MPMSNQMVNSPDNKKGTPTTYLRRVALLPHGNDAICDTIRSAHSLLHQRLGQGYVRASNTTWPVFGVNMSYVTTYFSFFRAVCLLLFWPTSFIFRILGLFEVSQQ